MNRINLFLFSVAEIVLTGLVYAEDKGTNAPASGEFDLNAKIGVAHVGSLSDYVANLTNMPPSTAMSEVGEQMLRSKIELDRMAQAIYSSGGQVIEKQMDAGRDLEFLKSTIESNKVVILQQRDVVKSNFFNFSISNLKAAAAKREYYGILHNNRGKVDQREAERKAADGAMRASRAESKLDASTGVLNQQEATLNADEERQKEVESRLARLTSKTHNNALFLKLKNLHLVAVLQQTKDEANRVKIRKEIAENEEVISTFLSTVSSGQSSAVQSLVLFKVEAQMIREMTTYLEGLSNVHADDSKANENLKKALTDVNAIRVMHEDRIARLEAILGFAILGTSDQLLVANINDYLTKQEAQIKLVKELTAENKKLIAAAAEKERIDAKAKTLEKQRIKRAMQNELEALREEQKRNE